MALFVVMAEAKGKIAKDEVLTWVESAFTEEKHADERANLLNALRGENLARNDRKYTLNQHEFKRPAYRVLEMTIRLPGASDGA